MTTREFMQQSDGEKFADLFALYRCAERENIAQEKQLKSLTAHYTRVLELLVGQAEKMNDHADWHSERDNAIFQRLDALTPLDGEEETPRVIFTGNTIVNNEKPGGFTYSDTTEETVEDDGHAEQDDEADESRAVVAEEAVHIKFSEKDLLMLVDFIMNPHLDENSRSAMRGPLYDIFITQVDLGKLRRQLNP